MENELNIHSDTLVHLKHALPLIAGSLLCQLVSNKNANNYYQFYFNGQRKKN